MAFYSSRTNVQRQNFNHRTSVLKILAIILIVCDRCVSPGGQQQVTSTAGFSGILSGNDDDDSGGNELSRQVDLPGKQLVMDDERDATGSGRSGGNDDQNDDELLNQHHDQRRQQWPRRQLEKNKRENSLPAASLNQQVEATNQFISVLNNQSNVITSPSLSTSSSFVDSRSNQTSAVFIDSSDPHLKELDGMIAQQNNPTTALNQSAVDVVVGQVQPTRIENDRTKVSKNKLGKVRKRKRKKQKSQLSRKKNLLYLNLLPHHQRRQPDDYSYLSAAEQRLIEYLNSFNASRADGIDDVYPGGQLESLINWRPKSHLAELMVTSSSQPPNEFETTLIMKPPSHHHEPIVAGSEASGLTSESAGSPPNSGSRNFGELDSDDGDDDDDDEDRDPLDESGGKSQHTDSTTMTTTTTTSTAATILAGGNTTKPAEENATSIAVGPFGSGSSPPQIQSTPLVVREQELLVGPFRSEAEAPATITLSGVVYQKSGGVRSAPPNLGATSRPLRGAKSKFPSDGGENLSTSPSSGSSSSADMQGGLVAAKPGASLFAELPLLDGAAGSVGQPTTTMATTAKALQHGLFRQSSGYRLPLSIALSASGSGGDGGHDLRLGGGSSLHEQLAKGSSELSGLRASSPSPTLLMNGPHSYYAAPASATSQEAAFSSSVSPSSLVASGAASGHLLDDPAAAALAGSQQWMLADGPLDFAASKHTKGKASKHHQPVVIVQKDVKPVKYHLMRAYLRLRRFLRPYEATYVFLN